MAVEQVSFDGISGFVPTLQDSHRQPLGDTDSATVPHTEEYHTQHTAPHTPLSDCPMQGLLKTKCPPICSLGHIK